MIFASLTRLRLPSPEQVGQAPYGLLNENNRGVISLNPAPQSSQEKFCDSVSSLAPGIDSTVIHKAEVAGTVTLRNAGPILIIDFDLSTRGPVDIVATYEDKTVWFNGFAQLESTGTSVSADDGQIRVQIEGKRRYAVYLHNSGSRNLSINLEFFANGEIVHEATLEYRQD